MVVFNMTRTIKTLSMQVWRWVERARFLALGTILLIGAAGCGGGSGQSSAGTAAGGPSTSAYTVGGTISGLTTSGLTLTDGSQTVSPAANATSFTFPTAVAAGSSYSVTVSVQPSGASCTVANGAGTVGSSNVTSVQITCATASKYTVGGTISGLTANGLVLANGSDTVAPAAGATSFTFSTSLSSGATYAVTVSTQPSGETCAITNNSGTIGTSNVTNVQVACTAGTGSTVAAVSYTGANINEPDALAIDASGNVWVANWNVSGVTEIKPPGSGTGSCPADCLQFGSAQGVGMSNYTDIAVDSSGNALLSAGASLTAISSTGVVSTCTYNYPAGSGDVGGGYIAMANNGDVWVSGGFVSPSIGVVTETCGLVSAANGVYVPGSSYQLAKVAIDAAGNAWVSQTSNTGSNGYIVEIPAANPAAPIEYALPNSGQPWDVAVDGNGNVWVAAAANFSGTTGGEVVEISPGAPASCASGCATYTASVLTGNASANAYASGIAIDGKNDVWVTDNGGDVLEIMPGAALNCSSGCKTYTISALTVGGGIAIDGAGNVWVADSAGSAVVELPALAAPTKTPIVAQTR